MLRNERPRILGCASQGSGGDDEARLRTLLSRFSASFIDFNRASKLQSFQLCLRTLRAGGFDLFVLEGTGVAAGFAAILGRLLYGRRYILSSGDAVAPFLSASLPMAAPVFELYERMLYRCSSGFIGWTPYLVGRALSMGAKRAVTAPGWSPFTLDPAAVEQDRKAVRARLQIPEDAIVFGIVGSLQWSARYEYCYGAELVRAARRAGAGVYVLIVGDGSGLPILRGMAGDMVDRTIFFTGRVERTQIPGYLAAMDVGSLPQSVDGVGSFRYTTKITEYREASLPFVTNCVPMGYDLDRGDIWRLGGPNPWSTQFIAELAELMLRLTPEEIVARRRPNAATGIFNKDEQIARVTAFLEELLADRSEAPIEDATDRR